VPLPRERFWDIQVAKIDSPTRQPLCPGRPAVAAALHFAEHHSAHNDWTACRMRLHMTCAGYGSLRLLRHFGHTPALYAYRGLSASGFALPWRTANVLFLVVARRSIYSRNPILMGPATGITPRQDLSFPEILRTARTQELRTFQSCNRASSVGLLRSLANQPRNDKITYYPHSG